MNRCNYFYRVLGLGEGWQGWGWRATKYLEALYTLPPKMVVILLDAYDAFAIRDSAEVCKVLDLISGLPALRKMPCHLLPHVWLV